jgi:hypothetical protein
VLGADHAGTRATHGEPISWLGESGSPASEFSLVLLTTAFIPSLGAVTSWSFG